MVAVAKRALIGMRVRRHSRASWGALDLLSSRGRELDHRFSGHPSAVFHLDALRLCRSRTSVPSARSPVFCVRPGWPPATSWPVVPRARSAPAHPAAPEACPAFRSISCSVLSGPKRTVPSPSVSLLMRYRKGQRVVRMGSATAIRGRSRSTSRTVRRSSCGSASAWHRGCRCRGGPHQNPPHPERRARHSAGWRTR